MTQGKRLVRSDWALLAISLLPMTTGVVSSAVAQISSISDTTSNLIVTMPSFAMTIMVILSGQLVKWFGTKRVVLSGLIITGLASLLAFWAPNIPLLLVARLILGIGLGCYNALAVSLIGVQYVGQKRQKLMGYQNAFQGLGAMLGSLVVSGLVLIGWRYAFLIYLISLPIAWTYFKNVPDIQLPKQPAHQPSLRFSSKGTLIYYVVVLFVLMIFYMIANLKIPVIILTRHLGRASTGAFALSLFSLGTILAGATFGYLKAHVSQWVLMISMLVMLLGFAGLLVASNQMVIMVAAFLIGASFGIYVPEIFNAVTELVPGELINESTMILMTSSNLASFSASFASELLKTNGTEASLIINIIIALGGLMMINLVQKQHQAQTIFK